MSEPVTTRAILITKPGVYPEITARQYFAEPCPQPALTASGIKTLLGRTPAEFAYAHPAITPDSEEAASTAAKRFGDVGHQLALGKGRVYAIGDFKDWRTKDAQTFKADAEASGLTAITIGKFEEAETCANIMIERIKTTLGQISGYAPPHGEHQPYQTETVIAWQEDTPSGPVWCRAMLDVWAATLGIILDPKFSERLSDGVFENHATNMGWDLQSAWYMRGLENLFPESAGRLRFINLLVSPKPPHVSRAREADEATRYSCQLEIERALVLFGKCLKADDWPGYPNMVEPWTAKSWTMAERAQHASEETAE